MFTKPCPVTAPHEAHEHIHHWPKDSQEPEGWFPPDSYMETVPAEGSTATYKCMGTLGKPLELSRDLINGVPRYESCDKCNYDDHICGGCGEYLTHSGHVLEDGEYVLHGTSCVD